MLTVIFTTRNGSRTLPIVLEAYRALREPKGGWRLVVVDNGSTDETPKILEEFSQSLPLTCLRVATPGKNRALNAALSHREGDLIVLTDDDAVPGADWLVEMRRAADMHGEFDLFAGAIRPRWESPPEAWHLEWVPMGVTYTITDPGLRDGPAGAAVAWGPNMAVRARVFDTGNRFDELIGPESGESYRMGSESEFTNRMEALGYRTWFVSAAIVEHIIRSFQMERSWVLARASRFGRGLCYRDSLSQSTAPRMLFGFPRYCVRRLIEHAVRLWLAKLLRRKKRAFLEAWELHFEWGYLREARSLASER